MWIEIEGYNGDYLISDNGVVLSLKNGSRRYLKPSLNKRGGHWYIYLSKDAKQKKHYLHCLVAAAFIGPRPEGQQVCHNDGDPSNNEVGNLRYDTPSGNQLDRVKHGTDIRGDKSPTRTINEVDARSIKKRYVRQYEKIQRGWRSNANELAAEYNLHRTQVQRIASGKKWAWLDTY